MVPENEFHYKEPASTANPGALQNGPGSSGKPGTAAPASANAGKNEEGAAEDTGESSRKSAAVGSRNGYRPFDPICSFQARHITFPIPKLTVLTDSLAFSDECNLHC